MSWTTAVTHLPAAAFVCPRFDLLEPIRRGDFLEAFEQKTSAIAAHSKASAFGTPVPFVSTYDTLLMFCFAVL